jgi:3',5'-cyclic AMP phosphodiesterase CpdA
MITRRNLLVGTGSIALVSRLEGFEIPAARAQDAPLFSFGIFSDPQYAPVPPRGTRFYANSLWKVQSAITEVNKQKLAFVTTLGDIIDRHWQSYEHILPLYDKLEHPHFFVLGNHDYEVGADYLHAVHRTTGLKKAYYDFKGTGAGYRFIVVDGNDISLFANPKDSPKYKLAAERLAKLEAAKAPNAQTWNGTLSEEQFAWLKTTMDDAQRAGEKVVIFGHYPVFPVNEHNIWDDARFVDLVTGYPNFVAYFNGHNHFGNYGAVNGKHFVNMRGMVETATETAYATVDVYGDRLELKGVGKQESRTLKLA